MSIVPPIVLEFGEESKTFTPNFRDIVEFERAFDKSMDDLIGRDAEPHLDWILYIAHSVARRQGETADYLTWIEDITGFDYGEAEGGPLEQEP